VKFKEQVTNQQVPNQLGKYNKAILQMLTGATFILSQSHVNAAELTTKLRLSAGAEYDSNPALTANKEPVWIYSLTPQLQSNIKDEVNHWYLDAALAVQRHSNERSLVNREDPSITVGWDRTYVYGLYGIKADYRESSSRIDELTSTGVFANAANTEKAKGLSAKWQLAISPRLSILTDAAYRDISYSVASKLADYSLGDIRSKLTYATNETLDTFVQIGYAQLRPDNTFDKTDITRLMVGADSKLNENFNLGVRAGVYNLSGRQSETDWEAGVDASYNTEKTNYSLGLYREITATGFGGFQKANLLKLGLQHSSSEHDRFGVDYSFSQYKADVRVGLNDIDYQQISAFYERDIGSHWQARVSGAHKELDSLGVNNKGNIVGVVLVYDSLVF
jgi:hypothetical protein